MKFNLRKGKHTPLCKQLWNSRSDPWNVCDRTTDQVKIQLNQTKSCWLSIPVWSMSNISVEVIGSNKQLGELCVQLQREALQLWFKLLVWSCMVSEFHTSSSAPASCSASCQRNHSCSAAWLQCLKTIKDAWTKEDVFKVESMKT